MATIDVYFDLTCRYAHRLNRWLDGLDIDADWRPFSLLEAHRDDDGPPVWDRDDHADNISLLMLAGHELVRDRDGDVGGYRAALFHAWHDTDRRLDGNDVTAEVHAAGADADRDDLQAAVKLVGEQHEAAVEHGVFGSSTIVFGPGQGWFFRLAAVPSTAEGGRVLAALRALAGDLPELEHLEPLHR